MSLPRRARARRGETDCSPWPGSVSKGRLKPAGDVPIKGNARSQFANSRSHGPLELMPPGRTRDAGIAARASRQVGSVRDGAARGCPK
jgi:hypothetical protein